LAFIVLALACVSAAAGGAYVAVRHNDAASPATLAASPAVASHTAKVMPVPANPNSESVVPESAPVAAPKSAERNVRTLTRRTAVGISSPKAAEPKHAWRAPIVARAVALNESAPVGQPEPIAAPVPPLTPAPPPDPKPAVDAAPDPPHTREFDEVVIPASSVLGLQIESTVSSEVARVEDRVQAHVTRDVLVDGRVAIPAGARVVGSVTLVDRGGKLKTPARVAIRFNTLVLPDGTQVPLRTQEIMRDGGTPGPDSARKIGGAAIVGALLGAIVGGGKGAAIGGTAGGAAGTAAAMAGDRYPAIIPQGATFSVRLATPATIQIERQ
ncbi:MAG TPA: TrbI/VirB10 family protein, partial [Vicinamibacterales bacterium]